jgi:hypothetical protein
MLGCRLIPTSALPAYVFLPSPAMLAVCPRIPQTIDHKEAISDYPLKTAHFGVALFPGSGPLARNLTGGFAQVGLYKNPVSLCAAYFRPIFMHDGRDTSM